MTTINVQTLISGLFSQITTAELQLVKEPALSFATALETPGANALTIQNAAANFMLQIPQLNGPAQAAALNIVGVGLTSFINSIGTSGSSGSGASIGTAAATTAAVS